MICQDGLILLGDCGAGVASLPLHPFCDHGVFLYLSTQTIAADLNGFVASASVGDLVDEVAREGQITPLRHESYRAPA